MKTISKILVLLALTTPALASNNNSKWLSLVEDVVNNKDRVEANNYGFYFVKEEITPINDTEHLANYISAVIKVSEEAANETEFEGIIRIEFIDMVWEKWNKQPNGDWHLDQWTFRVSPYGEYVDGRHNNVIKSEVKERQKSETVEVEEEVALLAKWESLKQGWLNSIP